MPRSILIVFLFIAAVLASVITSVLLAFRGVPTGGPTRIPTDEDQVWWERRAPPSFDRSLANATESTGFGITFEQFRGPARNPDGNNFDLVNRIRTGWPARSLEGYAYTEKRKAHQAVFLVHLKSAGWYADAWVPYRPLWSGVAINAVAFSAIFAAVTVFVGLARRAVRRARGQCVQCRYPLTDNRTCPECGSTLPN